MGAFSAIHVWIVFRLELKRDTLFLPELTFMYEDTKGNLSRDGQSPVLRHSLARGRASYSCGRGKDMKRRRTIAAFYVRNYQFSFHGERKKERKTNRYMKGQLPFLYKGCSK